MRTPQRIAGFLIRLKKYDGQVLTNELIDKIVKDVIRKKLYWTMYLKSKPDLKSVYESEDIYFTDEQLEEIVANSPQKHKESGFDKGWPSRFQTWYGLCKEFGFADYGIGKTVNISQSGHMLCDAYEPTDTEEDVSKTIQNVFLNALVKYPSNNPFRRNANENIPLLLLMNVIKLLKEDENNAGVSRKEIPFILCWPDNDATKLYKYIKDFRAKYGFTASDDTVYKMCLNLLNSTNETRFKKSQITKEAVDDFLRKMRVTGVIALRGMGRFVDFNKLESQKIEYVLKNYGEYRTFATELEYYNFIGKMDAQIVSIETDAVTYNIQDIRKAKLSEVASKYSNEQIRYELELLSTNRGSKDLYFSDIDEPTRLEFLTSIALQQALAGASVEPNYHIDDEGNPTFTASGGLGDIEVYDSSHNSLFEVTLMRGKNQAVLEIPAIKRHLDEIKEEKNKFAVFVAPFLHADATFMIDFTKYHHKLDIFGYTITEFCEKLKTTTLLQQFDKSITKPLTDPDKLC